MFPLIVAALVLLQTPQAPGPEEQLLIYELNRARAAPTRYAQENGLGSMLDGVAASPPLAINTKLVGSASFHAEEMAANDYFAHQSAVDGRWPNQMALDSGYLHPWPGNQNYIESLAGGYSTVLTALVGLIEDAGHVPPGHREHLLATGPNTIFWMEHREIGTGYAVNGAALYQRYYAIHTARVNAGDLFLTGVVYSDANGNGRYDLGEGIGGVTVTDGATPVTTNASGGWAIPVANGAKTVTATGGTFIGTSNAGVTVAGANLEIDFESGTALGEVAFANQPPPPPPSPSPSPDPPADEGGGGGRCGSLGLDLMLPLALLLACRAGARRLGA